LNTISNTNDKKLDTILNKHANVFQGLGKLKSEKVKLNIDKHQTPKAQPQRRIPQHIREKVKDALKDVEKQDESESQPTPWVSPIVAVLKKDGGVRICVDMPIKRVRRSIPMVDDVSFELNGAQFFSKL
jgi:aspartate/methionine/tyrosine aminotransferase